MEKLWKEPELGNEDERDWSKENIREEQRGQIRGERV